MNQLNEGIRKEPDGFELARKLREEARALEEKEKIKRRLLQLIEISQDPYYDQYLAQMLRDLESGKASPAQVTKEADRTYRLYLQRMGKVSPAGGQVTGASMQGQRPVNTQSVPVPEQENRHVQQTKNTVEFKVGASIFSTVGAVFVLASLVILGFNFLEGIWQGLCLYVASFAVILLSELLLKRVSRTFSLVITGIGISALFISTVINYLVLKNINGLVASVITIAIALFSILISRKKDATSIRLITIFGCYISFLPIKGFESELSFLIMTGMLLMINLASIFLPNQSNRALIGCVHIVAHTIFTGIATGIVLADEIGVLYASCFVVTSLVVLNLIYWQQRNDCKLWLNIVFSVAIGFCGIYLIATSCFNHELDFGLELFYKILSEVMVLAVAAIFFILWNKKSERWIQYYFAAGIIVFFNGFTDYMIETTIAILLLYALTRIAARKTKELEVLDCILEVIVAVQGFWVSETWQIVPFVAVVLLMSTLLNRKVIFHEIVITLFYLIAVTIRMSSDWSIPVGLGVLFAMFLFANHWPTLREQTRQPYNIFNVVMAAVLSLYSFTCDSYWINSVTMVIGAVMILVVFKERYQLAVKKRYFILIGYLTYMILVAHFKTPVIVSGLLMVVAISCVGIGFWKKEKSYRICGLVMAVFVCLKLIIFDFKELDTLPKAVLFLLVGVIALIISFLYIYLEKKEDKEEEEESGIKQYAQKEQTMPGVQMTYPVMNQVKNETEPEIKVEAVAEGEAVKADAEPEGEVVKADAEPEGEMIKIEAVSEGEEVKEVSADKEEGQV